MKSTFIVSDFHLGSPTCRAKTLCEFLDYIKDKSERLILNGDIFDSMDFRRLNKHHWRVLSLLRKMSDDMEIVWTVGNHEKGKFSHIPSNAPAEIISHLLGLEVVEEYSFISSNKKILTLHGHIFDEFLDDHPVLTIVGDAIYNFLQKIDPSHYIARFVKHSSKHYLRCTKIIRTKAIKKALKQGFDIICCAHVHHPEIYEESGVLYANSGSWTEKPCSCIEIKNGEVSLEFYD